MASDRPPAAAEGPLIGFGKMATRLLRVLRPPWPRRPRLDRLRVVLYTRAGCHLCDVAWQRLRREQRWYRFTLEAVDVDTDPALAGRYGLEVPVVTVDGKVRFRGFINPVLWRRLLDVEAAKAGRR